jgi:hypothetical protein
VNPHLPRAALLLVVLLGACEPQTARHPEPLGPLEHLATPAGPGSTHSNLSVAPDGTVYLTWQEVRADSSRQLRFASLRDDRWSDPHPIASGSDWLLTPADAPSLLILGEEMVAQYLQLDHPGRDDSHGMRLVRSTDGGATWSRPVAPQRDSLARRRGFVSLFPGLADSVGLVWLDGPGLSGDSALAALRYAALTHTGAFGSEAVLDSAACAGPLAVATAGRGTVVAYHGRTTGELRDVRLVRRIDGVWAPGRVAHPGAWEASACPGSGPALATEDDRVALSWFTAARDTPRVLVAFSDDGAQSFAAPIRVDGGRPLATVGAVLLESGGALVSWIERTGDETAEVQARLVTTSGRVGNPLLIAQLGDQDTLGLPRMARGADGVIFTWTGAGRKPRVQTARIHFGELR